MGPRQLERVILLLAIAASVASGGACSGKDGLCQGPPATITRLAYPFPGVVTEPVGTTLPTGRCKEICNYDVVSCKVVAAEGGTAVECTEPALPCE